MQVTQSFLAPAKINLFLHITGQRSNGYHTLQSIFLFLDVFDTLSITVRDDGEIHRSNPLPGVTHEQDLCVRAAKALQKHSGCKLGADIHLHKIIPMGGGLGGGSSDAATVLIALNQLWHLNLSRAELMQIGVSLGADVPVFIFGQTAWAEGIGEQLSPIFLPETFYNDHYIVVTPQINVPTAQIFANSALTRNTKPLKIADFSSKAYSEVFRNDLENIVCKEFSAVANTLTWLNQYGQARMSGSGASVFLAVNSETDAKKILLEKPENTTGFIAKGLKYHPHIADVV
jgi:4-diphosphocytidyl-2-C-methyl-D-erythritol kinase